MLATKTLNDLRDDIRRELRYLDIKEHSHHIISFSLRSIANHFGKDEANKAIRELKLDRKGWSEQQ